MTNPKFAALQAAIADYLSDDETANVTIVDIPGKPSIALIRADVLEVYKAKAADHDAREAGDGESDIDMSGFFGKE